MNEQAQFKSRMTGTRALENKREKLSRQHCEVCQRKVVRRKSKLCRNCEEARSQARIDQ